MAIFPEPCTQAARALLDVCETRHLRLATAESCTGGLIVACLTEFAGSSTVVDRGYVTYDDRAKQEMLGVRADTLRDHGAVSERTAREMVEGALKDPAIGVALSVTGVAGPGGGTPAKPVGLVHMAAGVRGGPILHERHLFAGDREAVRLATVEAALRLALRAIEAGASAAGAMA
jgi:nicotinamide-nucleotide amidase